MIGDACSTHVITGGNGSGHVDPYYQSSPLAGITAQAKGAQVTFTGSADTAAAAAAAKAADVAIVCTATSSSEGRDRLSLNLDNGANALVAAVAAAAKKTVVLIVAPGAVLTPFAKDVDAIIWMGMPGQEEGT